MDFLIFCITLHKGRLIPPKRGAARSNRAGAAKPEQAPQRLLRFVPSDSKPKDFSRGNGRCGGASNRPQECTAVRPPSRLHRRCVPAGCPGGRQRPLSVTAARPISRPVSFCATTASSGVFRLAERASAAIRGSRIAMCFSNVRRLSNPSTNR